MTARSTNGPTWKAVFSYLEAGTTIIGIDEVGRGAWAGPVTAAAVILPPRIQIPGLNDSKLLSAASRHKVDKTIRRVALGVGIGWVSSQEVDHYGLSWAVAQSGLRALSALPTPTSRYIVVLDGRVNYLLGHHPAVAFVKADATVVPVAAASVVAKVARDHYMMTLGNKFRGYSFGCHKGYGTAAHRQAIAQAGISPIHRKTVKPVARSIVNA